MVNSNEIDWMGYRLNCKMRIKVGNQDLECILMRVGSAEADREWSRGLLLAPLKLKLRFLSILSQQTETVFTDNGLVSYVCNLVSHGE